MKNARIQFKKFFLHNYSQPKYLLYFFNLNIHKYISYVLSNEDINKYKPMTNIKYQSNIQIWNNNILE